MVRVIEASKRYFSDFGWLKTYWLFSFADYFDPENIQFGALRVFNDDTVLPGTGFPTHPHREMEIITLVLSGEITHEDSMGNKSVIKAGDVQRMSAGTGLTHSEFNLADEPVHFYQIWIYPDVSGLAPTYDQRSFSGFSRSNRFVPLASGQGLQDVVTFHTAATIYAADIERGRTIDFTSDDPRRAFIYVSEGNLTVNGVGLREKDQARIDEEGALSFKALDKTSLVLIDVPSCKGWGYSKETLKGSRR